MESPFKAMVALKQPGRIEARSVIERMKDRFPAFASHPEPRVIDAPEDVRGRHDVQYMGFGSLVIELLFLDRPILNAMVEDAVERSIFWPEAAAAMAGHGGHAMLSAALPKVESGKDAVLLAAATTFASAALADLMPAVGVLWRESGSVLEISRFQVGAEQMKAGDIPVNLWVGFQPIRGQEAWYGRKTGTTNTPPIGILTTGMYPFIQREVDFLPVDRKLGDIALYTDIACRNILVRGGEVPDGDVIKVNQSEQVWLRAMPEGQRPGLPVWAMMLEPEGMPAGTPQGSAQQGAAQTGSGPRHEPCKFMGILALSNINVFDPRELAGQLAARFPAYRGPTFDHVERPEEEAGPRESYWFRAGDVTAKISLIPSPILPTVLEAAVRTARDWPDAARYLSGHRAQAVVELFSPAGATIAGRVDAACMTLMLCAALADLTPAMGVYWKSGGTITEPDRFRQRLETMLDGDLPFDIMVQINRLRNAPFISTTGLRDLLGREMEFAVEGLSETEAVERTYAACRQLVAHGDSLRDGEPIPFEGKEAIVPKALVEGAREDIPVWSLTFVERGADSAADSDIRSKPFAGDAAPVTDSAPNGNAAPRRPMQQMPRGRPGGDKCEPGSFTAFLALEQPAAVGEAELIERMRTLFPQLQSRIETGTREGEERAAGDPIVFSMGGRMMMIMFLDQPMPPGTMTVAARASRTWPEAEEQLDAHRAHVIVHAGANTKDWNGALDSAQNVSVVSATLADMLPTIGIYWSEGWVVAKAAAFIQATQHVLARKYSGAEWFQFWFLEGPPTDGGEATTAVLTTGLEPFFGWEIEFLPTSISPATSGHRLLGLIEYLLTNGPVLKDGDTMGVSYEEAIRVRFAKQGQRPGIPVIQLTLEKIDETVPPFQGKQAGKPSAAGRDGVPQTGRGETGVGDNLEKFTTYIPLKRVAVADEDRFGDALKMRFPDLHANLVPGWRKVDISAFGERFAFDLDGHEVGIMFVSGPSRPDMVAPALRAGGAWPEAEAELTGHQGCLVVHVEPLGDDWSAALNCARIVTAVSAILAEIYPAIGVTWSEADTFTRADRFVEMAPMILAGKYAKAAWVRRWTSMDSSSSEGQRTVAMGTVGLAAFIGREIEFVPARVDPGIMAKRLLGAVQYLLTRGPVLKHGGALKVSETERLRIHLADEGETTGVPIYRLKLEMADDNAPTADNGPATAVSKGKDEEKRPRFGRRVIT